ncbi:outer membrane protein assembly factor BamA [Kiritimatiellota bacterium B12222]|nr:outer membrane protein assembly factor BamA [Kiritimatiellota bacterium B12222]
MKKINNLCRPLLLGVACLLLSLRAFGDLAPLTAISLQGDPSINQSEALEAMELPLGNPFEPETAQAAADRLRQYYWKLYHPMAQVKWQAVPVDGQEAFQLVVTVEPGPKGRLQLVVFTGNEQVASSDLFAVLDTIPREGTWNRLVRKDRLNLEELEADRRRLIELYHHLGYPDVEIGVPVLEKPKGFEGFQLTWPITQEGQQYSIGSIGFDADTLPSSEILESLITVEPGDVYDSRQLRSIQVRFQQYLLNEGYAFSSVDLKLLPQPDERQMDLVFIVKMGTRPVLRDIHIRGNEVTQDHVILRNVDVQPGDVFSGVDLSMTKAQLEIMPMFSQVALNYDGDPASGFYDLNVDVKERKSGRFEVGVGYGETDEVTFQVNLLEQNLSLLPPFKGDGLVGRVSASVSDSFFSVDGAITNPRVHDSEWNWFNQAYWEDSALISDYYDQQTLLLQSIFSYPIYPDQLIGIGLSATSYHIYDVDPLIADQLPESERDVNVTSVVSYWDLNKTDNVFLPTSGGRVRLGLELATEALGGNIDMVGTRLDAAYFYSPFPEQVLSIQVSVENKSGMGDSETLPLPLRLYLGGGQNLRGFDYRSVSPANAEGELIGGQGSWWASVEYRFPTISWLDLVLFLDVGDVTLDAYEFSGEGPVSDAGFGFLIFADNFPVRFDIATPLNTYETDTINEVGDFRLSFSAGYRFY